MRVSEIHVKQIRVNQGLGVYDTRNVNIMQIFDHDACWNGPINYFVGFQRFTQIFTRNTRRLDV